MARPKSLTFQMLARNQGGWVVVLGNGSLFRQVAGNLSQLRQVLDQAARVRRDELRRRELQKLGSYQEP